MRAEPVEIEPGFRIRVAQIEDIIGLKVQALSNNPARAENDWNDIRLLVRAAREQGSTLDWELLRDYFALFGLDDRLPVLKSVYDGKTQ